MSLGMYRWICRHIITPFISLSLLLSITYTFGQQDRIVMEAQILSSLNQNRSTEICDNGIDDDGDGLTDCEDTECEVLQNGGFEDVPIPTNPNAFVTFPEYPAFLGSWAAVNIDGEVFYEAANRPAYEGHKYASLLQNAGMNNRQPWNEQVWEAGGYDRFLFIGNTFPEEDYTMTFYHAGDNRYTYTGDQTLVQVQSLQTDYYYDTLIATPDLFDWSPATINIQTDESTFSLAIMFSAYGPGNASVVLDALNFCGRSMLRIDAVDDYAVTAQDAAVPIPILLNDLNIPENTLSVNVTEPEHGQVDLLADGTVNYNPDPGYSGADSFSYTLCNTELIPEDCDVAWVYIDIEPAPTVSIDTFYVLMSEDDTLSLCGIYFETGPDITAVDVIQFADFGNTIQNIPCTGYVPHGEYSGNDTLVIAACNDELCDTSVFIITVQPVNDQPEALDDRAVTREDTPVFIEILENDYDGDGQLFLSRVSILEEPVYGDVDFGPGHGLSYTPKGGYIGVDTVKYLVCDNGSPSLCDWAYIIIDVLPLSDTVYLTLLEDQSLPLCGNNNISNFGIQAPVVHYVLEQGSALTEMQSSCHSYQPQQHFYGGDTVIIMACSKNMCDSLIYVLDILPVNDPPIAIDDHTEANFDRKVTVDVSINDTDPIDQGEIDPWSVRVVRQPLFGSVENEGGGQLSYVPGQGFSGRDSLEYEICDYGYPAPVLCDVATVFIDVAEDGGSEQIRCMIPESFSPNGDDLYDYFNIECADYYPELVLQVFDRFGNQMYQSEAGYRNDWDGTASHSGKPLRRGTYYWVVRFNDGKTRDRAGYVLLWR